MGVGGGGSCYGSGCWWFLLCEWGGRRRRSVEGVLVNFREFCLFVRAGTL